MLWDFRVFTQIYVLQKAGGISRNTNLLGVWAYQISIGENDVGAAVAIVMVLFTVGLAVAFLAAVAVSRFRFRGRRSFIVIVLVVQTIPAEALIISLFKVVDG